MRLGEEGSKKNRIICGRQLGGRFAFEQAWFLRELWRTVCGHTQLTSPEFNPGLPKIPNGFPLPFLR